MMAHRTQSDGSCVHGRFGRAWIAAACVSLSLALSLSWLVPAAQGAEKPGASFGTWSNPKGSVHVRAEPCGAKMCGVVVWANAKATADAARGGTSPLVGATLFRDFVRAGPDKWRGKVFVPDIGKTFSGTIRVVGPDRLEGKGCLLGGIGCRSQVWTRLPG